MACLRRNSMNVVNAGVSIPARNMEMRSLHHPLLDEARAGVL